MQRSDITNTVVHFVSADTDDLALETLWRILSERRLLGTTRMIKGGARCVCFTEAPIEHVSDILLLAEKTGYRYKPFGVVMTKKDLFEAGGRPVIYQPDAEFSLLPPELQWRHVRYEPNATPPIDFSWEREWRLHIDQLPIDPETCVLVVPNKAVEAELRGRHDAEEFELSVLRADGEPDRYEPGSDMRPFSWRVYTLAD